MTFLQHEVYKFNQVELLIETFSEFTKDGTLYIDIYEGFNKRRSTKKRKRIYYGAISPIGEKIELWEINRLVVSIVDELEFINLLN